MPRKLSYRQVPDFGARFLPESETMDQRILSVTSEIRQRREQARPPYVEVEALDEVEANPDGERIRMLVVIEASRPIARWQLQEALRQGLKIVCERASEEEEED